MDMCLYSTAAQESPPNVFPVLITHFARHFEHITDHSMHAELGCLLLPGGYMVMAGVTTKYVFDLQPGDVYWCTADCGWITGHTYLTYGPLLNGAQSVIYEGVPTYPDPSRCWQIVEKHKVG